MRRAPLGSVERMVTDTPTTQTAQRIKVGMTGLAVVLLLIGLASAIFRSASVNIATPSM